MRKREKFVVKFASSWGGRISEKRLEHKFVVETNEDGNSVIELSSLDDLFEFAELVGHNVILSNYIDSDGHRSLTVYDDYIE